MTKRTVENQPAARLDPQTVKAEAIVPKRPRPKPIQETADEHALAEYHWQMRISLLRRGQS